MILDAVLLFVWAVPSTVSTQIFAWLFNNQFGAVNYLLDKLPGVTMHGHDWFAEPDRGARASSPLVVVWGAIPLLAISLHAGITQIPQDVLEAARVRRRRAVGGRSGTSCCRSCVRCWSS